MRISTKISNRPQRTTVELIDLINRRREDWWPEQVRISINRSAEHDWIAITDPDAGPGKETWRTDLAKSVDEVVSQLRLSNAWSGH
jgi:hypothetical protein